MNRFLIVAGKFEISWWVGEVSRWWRGQRLRWQLLKSWVLILNLLFFLSRILFLSPLIRNRAVWSSRFHSFLLLCIIIILWHFLRPWWLLPLLTRTVQQLNDFACHNIHGLWVVKHVWWSGGNRRRKRWWWFKLLCTWACILLRILLIRRRILERIIELLTTIWQRRALAHLVWIGLSKRLIIWLLVRIWRILPSIWASWRGMVHRILKRFNWWNNRWLRISWHLRLI